MPSFAILRAKKLKTVSQISGSARHTYRENPPLNADPTRTQYNEYGRIQSAATLLSAVTARLPDRRRRDSVLVIEYLVGASPEWFMSREAEGGKGYFTDALRWITQRHGDDNVLAWAVHRDESTPHLVGYVVPLDPHTGRLNAKRWLGGRQVLSQMQTEFAALVGRRHGLERGFEGSRATHQRLQQWYAQLTQLDPPARVDPQDAVLGYRDPPGVLAVHPDAIVSMARAVPARLSSEAPAGVGLEMVGERQFPQMPTLAPPVAKPRNQRVGRATLLRAIPVIRKATGMGFNGFGGNCYAAAIAMNHVLFDDRLSYFVVANDALYGAGRVIGHATLFIQDATGNRRHIDADARIKSDSEVEGWGRLDVEDPDYQQIASALGIAWNEDTAGSIAFFEASEADILKLVKDKNSVAELEQALLRAVEEWGHESDAESRGQLEPLEQGAADPGSEELSW